MQYLNLFLVFICALLKYSAPQENCEPCKCYNNTMDCTRKSSGIVTKIPTIPDLLELVLTGQPLENIHGDLFKDCGSSQVLSLQNCKLNFVHRDSFRQMPNLSEIDLSFNDLHSLDKNIFRANEKLVTVKLNNNQLHIVKDRMFANQRVLAYLYLQNNIIPKLSKEVFVHYPGLKILNMDNNLLTYIDGEIIQNSEGLSEIYIDNNPFICDCNLQALYKAMKEKHFYGVNSKCASPRAIQNEALIDLSSHDFTCPIQVYSLSNTTIYTYEENITLLCMVEAKSEPNVMWIYNNNIIYTNNNNYQFERTQQNATSWTHNLTIHNLTLNDTGAYICKAINTGYTNQTVFNLTVNPALPPKILIPNSSYIFVDLHEENYTIPFKIHAVPKPLVTWTYRDKILISNTTDVGKSVYCNESTIGGDTYWFNLTIKKVKLKYRTEFTCNVSNLKGFTNKTITLIILYPHGVTFEPSQNILQVTEGQNLTIICKLTAVPPPDILWRYGHLTIESNTSPSKYKVKKYRDSTGVYWNKLTITKVEQFEGGVYKCEANNSEEIDSQEFVVLVNKMQDTTCDSKWLTTFFIVVGCLLIAVLVIIIVLKCCIRYYVSKNSTQEYTYRISGLLAEK